MSSLRLVILLTVAGFSLVLGALFALPSSRKEFVRVEINNVPVVAEVARSVTSRAQGLAGREDIPRLGGMLFVFESPIRAGIWMKGMKFPLDIFWIKDGKVVDMEESVPPAYGTPIVFTPEASADFVLETNAGFAKTHGISIGNEVKIVTDDNSLLLDEASDLDAASEFFIETLRKKGFQGDNFAVKKLLSKNEAYQKFEISYSSGGLTISGIMNVPSVLPPKEGFPLLVLNHGLIPAEAYFSGRGSKREQDFFARRGYVTIHPDYRGLASSSPAVSDHHDFYVGYTEDVINLLEALEKARPSLVDLKRVGMWGHSMGGGIASRVMVLEPFVRAYVLFAPISADAEDNFFELPQKEVRWLRETYGEDGDPVYQKISPLNYFSDVSAPVQIHHGTKDSAVPIAFSEKMYETLRGLGKKVEFFKYPGQEHEFIEDWPLAAERTLQFFDKYVKDAR